jgi:hypothetical protein
MVETPDYYAAMLNANGTINSAAHPAKRGSVVTTYANGTEATTPAGDDAARVALPLKNPLFPVTMQVEGQTVSCSRSEPYPLWRKESPRLIKPQVPASLPGTGGTNAFIRIEMGRIPTSFPRDLSFHFTQ